MWKVSVPVATGCYVIFAEIYQKSWLDIVCVVFVHKNIRCYWQTILNTHNFLIFCFTGLHELHRSEVLVS